MPYRLYYLAAQKRGALQPHSFSAIYPLRLQWVEELGVAECRTRSPSMTSILPKQLASDKSGCLSENPAGAIAGISAVAGQSL